MKSKGAKHSGRSLRRPNRRWYQPRRTTNWDPIWLRKTVLYAFMGSFILMVVGLILVNHFVSHYQGLSLSLGTNHYTWTYGPTAVLVIIISLWRQVSYCAMVNQPWYELSKGQQPASRTVLLDYLWPLQITSFTTAMNNKHFAVAASIFIFASLKVIIIVSTTLFLPRDSLFSHEVQMQLSTTFNSTMFWTTTPTTVETHEDNGTISAEYTFTPGQLPYSNISADAVWAYRNMFDTYPDPESRPIELATTFTNFSLSSAEAWTRSTKVTAVVDVFQPTVSCEVADVVSWSQDEPGQTLDITLRSPSCNVGPLSVSFCNHLQGPCGSRAQFFTLDRVPCTGEGHWDSESDVSKIDEMTPNPYHYVLLGIESDVSASSESEFMYDAQIKRSVAVTCRMTYSIRPGTATVSLQGMSQILSLKTNDGDDASSRADGGIPKLSSLQFSEAILSSLAMAESIFGPANVTETGMGTKALLGLVLGQINSFVDEDESGTLDGVFDAQTLQRIMGDTFSGLSQQMAREYFLLPDDGSTSTSGNVEYRELRLHIRPVALWSMVGVLGIVAGAVLVIIMYTKTGVAPPSPELLITSVSTLVKSPEFSSLLLHTGAARSSQLRDHLANYEFTTIFDDDDGRPRIMAHVAAKKPEKPEVLEKTARRSSPVQVPWGRNMHKPDSENKMVTSTQRPWVPYPARRHAIALTLLLPILSIAALEIMWLFSVTDDSFVTMPTDSDVAAYAIRYGSTAAVLLIATQMNSLEFTIATLTPFSRLSDGRSDAYHGAFPDQTLRFSLIGGLPPVSLFKALRFRHFGAALSLFASTVGSVLTIVISGLWFLDTSVSLTTSAVAKLQSGWSVDFGSINSTLDNSTSNAATLYDVIQHGGSDDAKLIWNDFVLPAVDSVQVSGELVNTYVNDPDTHEVRLEIPMMRAVLECSAIPESFTQVETKPVQNGIEPPYLATNFSATIKLPDNCRSSSMDVEDPDTVNVVSLGDFRSPADKGPYWVTALQDLAVTAAPGSSAAVACPSLALLYSKYDQKGKPVLTAEVESTVLALTCIQRLQVVTANVTYAAGSLSPNLTAPPQLMPGSETFAVDLQTNASSLSYAMASHFENGATAFDPEPEQHTALILDHLTLGPGGASLESLLDARNMTDALDKLYRRFMARVIDQDYRVTLDELQSDTEEDPRRPYLQPGPADGIVPGQLTRIVSRLKMNEPSKIALEVLLGVMVAFGALSYWLVDMRGILPRSPFSIASSMALFERSQLLHDLKGSQSTDSDDRGTGRSLDEDGEVALATGRNLRSVVDGKLFRLGWWESSRAEDSDGTTGFGNTPGTGPQVTVARFGIDVLRNDDGA